MTIEHFDRLVNGNLFILLWFILCQMRTETYEAISMYALCWLMNVATCHRIDCGLSALRALWLRSFFFRDSLFMMFSFSESSQVPPDFFTRLLTAARLLIALNTLTIFVLLSFNIYLSEVVWGRLWSVSFVPLGRYRAHCKMWFAHILNQLKRCSLLSIYVITLFRSMAWKACGHYTLDTVPVNN